MENMTIIDKFPRIFLLSIISFLFLCTQMIILGKSEQQLIIVVCYLQNNSSWETYLSQYKKWRDEYQIYHI
jgi:hypothetical protein